MRAHSPDDEDLPLEKVVVVDETCREPIDRPLAKFCTKARGGES